MNKATATRTAGDVLPLSASEATGIHHALVGIGCTNDTERAVRELTAGVTPRPPTDWLRYAQLREGVPA